VKPIVRIVFACGVLVSGLAAMTIAWDYIFPGRIYFCTDETGFGFWTPGEWVHGEVEYVPDIDTLRPMSEPDVIKAGWSLPGLWAVWSGMIGCVTVGAIVTPRLLGGAGEMLAKPRASG
jgi:hypothetical protein